MSLILALVVAVIMLGCLIAIPLGLPGLWIIVVITLGLVLAGSVTWTVGLAAAAAAGVAELGEFLVLRHFGRRVGGSSRAFWGAVIGGMAGLFVGLPVPLIGPLLTAFLGTFVGAGVVTYFETRSFDRSARVGWGLVLARTAAVGLKSATAIGVIAAVLVSIVR